MPRQEDAFSRKLMLTFLDKEGALAYTCPQVQPCHSWSGGCGQAVTQTCCHMVNVLNDHLSEPHLSLIRTS